GVAAELEDHADALAVALVADVADALELLLAHEVGGLLDPARLVHLERDFGDDDRGLARLHLLEVGLAADDDLAAAGLVGRDDAAPPLDDAARREVGAGH